MPKFLFMLKTQSKLVGTKEKKVGSHFGIYLILGGPYYASLPLSPFLPSLATFFSQSQALMRMPFP